MKNGNHNSQTPKRRPQIVYFVHQALKNPDIQFTLIIKKIKSSHICEES